MPPPQTTPFDITQFVRQVLTEDARRRTESVPTADPLHAAIDDWWNALPVVTRHRRYQLTEISDALFIRTGNRFANRHITAALESMAWTTGRDWTRAGRNRRYWLPLNLERAKNGV